MWSFVLSLLVPHLFFFRCLGKAELLDCSISGYLHLHLSIGSTAQMNYNHSGKNTITRSNLPKALKVGNVRRLNTHKMQTCWVLLRPNEHKGFETVSSKTTTGVGGGR